MKIWKVEIKGSTNYTLTQHSMTCTYSGTATTPEIAIRAANKCAKKDGLINRTVKTLECIGEKEFGRY